ncbi:MAG: hypothetical protein AB1725_02240 [Armatimonadota bacterium]
MGKRYLPILYALPALGFAICLANPDWWMPFGGQQQVGYRETARKVSPDGRLVAWVGSELWGMGDSATVVALFPVGVEVEEDAIREGVVFRSAHSSAVLSLAWLDGRTLHATTLQSEILYRRSNAFVSLDGERARVRVLFNDEGASQRAD